MKKKKEKKSNRTNRAREEKKRIRADRRALLCSWAGIVISMPEGIDALCREGPAAEFKPIEALIDSFLLFKLTRLLSTETIPRTDAKSRLHVYSTLYSLLYASVISLS